MIRITEWEVSVDPWGQSGPVPARSIWNIKDITQKFGHQTRNSNVHINPWGFKTSVAIIEYVDCQGLVKTELKQFWLKAKVVKRVGQTYILRLPNGTERRYHERQIKKYNLDDIETDQHESPNYDSDSL